MSTTSTVVYTARTRTVGGRESGITRSSDGLLDLRLAAPGTARIGANPEQLFAAAWSACLGSEIARAARARQLALPSDVVIGAEMDLITRGDNHFLRVRFNVTIPGVDHEVARSLVDEAHQTCPYSKATRGKIEVSICLGACRELPARPLTISHNS
jgi:osmotically inducible protein OsmC